MLTSFAATNLTPQVLERLKKIFDEKRWSIEPDDDRFATSLFERFCQSLSHLDTNETELILGLTEEFLWVKEQTYTLHLERALKSIDVSVFECSDEIYIVPVVSPNDRVSAKSGSFLLYPCQHIVVPKFPAIKSKLKGVINDPHHLKSSYPARRNALIIFLDDYIGSGKTFIEAWEDFEANIRIASDYSVVVSLVAQERAVERIRDTVDIHVYASMLRNRGISDSALPDIARAIEIFFLIFRAPAESGSLPRNSST